MTPRSRYPRLAVAIPFERGIRFTVDKLGSFEEYQYTRRNPLRAGHPVHGRRADGTHPRRVCGVAIPFERGIRFTAARDQDPREALVSSQSPSSGASGSRLLWGEGILDVDLPRRNPLRAGHPVHGNMILNRRDPTLDPLVAIPFERGIRFTDPEVPVVPFHPRRVAIPFERGIRFTGVWTGSAARARASRCRNPLRAGHPVHGLTPATPRPRGELHGQASQSPSSGASGSRELSDYPRWGHRWGSQSPSSGASGSRAAAPPGHARRAPAASQSPSSGASGSRPCSLTPASVAAACPSQSPSSGASGSRALQNSPALQSASASQSPSSGASGSRVAHA